MKVAVGGTFNVLHAGHISLFEKAFQISDFLSVGICSDEFASQTRGRVNPLSARMQAVQELLDEWGGRYEITVIEHPHGSAVEMDDLDAIVVSEETEPVAAEINELRLSKGLYPLEVRSVPMITDDSGERISASNIVAARKRIAVCTENPVKVQAVRSVMERLYGIFELSSVAVDNGVGEQPMGEKTIEGARNRALNALGDNDLGIGIEAGVFEMIDGMYDVQYCAVVDRDGNVTYGAGSAFRYPDRVADVVRGGATVGEAFPQVYGTEALGRSKGAIGFLSEGLLDRQKLTEQSVLAAMVPRIRQDLYEEE